MYCIIYHEYDYFGIRKWNWFWTTTFFKNIQFQCVVLINVVLNIQINKAEFNKLYFMFSPIELLDWISCKWWKLVKFPLVFRKSVFSKTMRLKNLKRSLWQSCREKNLEIQKYVFEHQRKLLISSLYIKHNITIIFF